MSPTKDYLVFISTPDGQKPFRHTGATLLDYSDAACTQVVPLVIKAVIPCLPVVTATEAK